MTPAPRAKRNVIVLALLVIALSACSSAAPLTSGARRAGGGESPNPSAAGAPHPSATTGGRPTATPRRTPARTSSPQGAPVARTVEWFVARLPKFPAAPRAQRARLAAQPGRAAWVQRIPTNQKVAFLTIDDGWIRRPEAAELLRAAKVPVTMFLTVNAVKPEPGYFKALQQNGAVIEAHTVTHRNLRGMPYADQKTEICGSADWLGTQYGRRPVLFRPPFGEIDDNTLRAAYDCGINACFHWTETVDKGKVFHQTSEHVIRAGDIILMHFRDAYADDFLAALLAIKAAGLTPALLENYVSVHSEG